MSPAPAPVLNYRVRLFRYRRSAVAFSALLQQEGHPTQLIRLPKRPRRPSRHDKRFQVRYGFPVGQYRVQYRVDRMERGVWLVLRADTPDLVTTLSVHRSALAAKQLLSFIQGRT